jgi:hypothetical protein
VVTAKRLAKPVIQPVPINFDQILFLQIQNPIAGSSPDSEQKSGTCSALVAAIGNMLRGAAHITNGAATGALSVGVAVGVLGAPESGGASFGVTGVLGSVAFGGYSIASDLDALGAFAQSVGTGDTSYQNEVTSQSQVEAQNVMNAGPAAPIVDIAQTIADGLMDTAGNGPPIANCH